MKTKRFGLFMLFCFAIFIVAPIIWSVLYFNPVTYTYFWGDENTRRLYDVYLFAKGKPDVDSMMNYVEKKNLPYDVDKSRLLINVYSSTAPEAVYIYFENNKIASVTFSPD